MPFRLDYFLIAVYLTFLLYLFVEHRKRLFYHFLVGTGVAIGWMLIGKNEYGYNQDFAGFAGFNFFPLFAWASGLFIAYIIYRWVKEQIKFKKCDFLWNFLLFTALYWPMLIFGETVGYHVFNVHNLATAQYAGLPFCDCLHAAPWMKVAYFTLGPVFFTACYILRLEKQLKP